MEKIEKMLEEVRTRNNEKNMSLSLVSDWIEGLKNNQFFDEKMSYWYYGNIEGFVWGLYASSLITKKERDDMIESINHLFL